ncbi:MAG: hypothetical protein M1167_02020, partial [Chloroflexi bacterium]|nr:hypothetical protein [Chloroflexota bacterium]
MTQLNSQEATAGNIEQGASRLNSIAINYFLYQNDPELTVWQTQFSNLYGNLSKLKLTSQNQTLVNNVDSDLQGLNETFATVVSYLQDASR